MSVVTIIHTFTSMTERERQRLVTGALSLDTMPFVLVCIDLHVGFNKQVGLLNRRGCRHSVVQKPRQGLGPTRGSGRRGCQAHPGCAIPVGVWKVGSEGKRAAGGALGPAVSNSGGLPWDSMWGTPGGLWVARGGHATPSVPRARDQEPWQ